MGKKIKAAQFKDFGEPDKVEVTTVELPELEEGEVLIKIKAAGVNPVDAIIQSGKYKDKLPHSLPVIPGWDLAGVVEDRGHAARRFNVEDEVYAYARRPEVKWGTFAEYMVVPESYLALRPQSLSWEESAAMPLAGLTAYQSLYDAGELKPEQKVLIIGASGGVGSFAIQLAKERNAIVIGVASGKNQEYMKKIGADFTIDYENENIGEAAKKIWEDGVDLIFDCVGGESLEDAVKALKSSGKVVSIKSQGDELGKDVDFEFVFVEPNASQLKHMKDMAENKKLKVEVTETYALDEVPEALKNIRKLHTKGKTVVVP